MAACTALNGLLCDCDNLVEISLKYELQPSPNRHFLSLSAAEILLSIQDKMQQATLWSRLRMCAFGLVKIFTAGRKL